MAGRDLCRRLLWAPGWGSAEKPGSRRPFIWWVINRLLFLAAVGSIQGFAQYYLADVLHIPNAATMTTVLLAVVAAVPDPHAPWAAATWPIVSAASGWWRSRA